MITQVLLLVPVTSEAALAIAKVLVLFGYTSQQQPVNIPLWQGLDVRFLPASLKLLCPD